MSKHSKYTDSFPLNPAKSVNHECPYHNQENLNNKNLSSSTAPVPCSSPTWLATWRPRPGSTNDAGPSPTCMKLQPSKEIATVSFQIKPYKKVGNVLTEFQVSPPPILSFSSSLFRLRAKNQTHEYRMSCSCLLPFPYLDRINSVRAY